MHCFYFICTLWILIPNDLKLFRSTRFYNSKLNPRTMRGYNLILRKLIVNNNIIYCDKLSSINWWKWYGIILMNNAICDDGDDDECMNKTFESWKYAAYIQKFRLQHTPTEVLRRILRFFSRLCITVSVNGPFNKCCYPFQDQLVS